MSTERDASFWRLWMNHREFLHKRSLRLHGGNRADAEDALSITLLRASRSYPGPGQVRNGKAWLHRLLHNVCMDLHREGRRYVSWEAVAPAVSQLEDSAASPEERMRENELAEAVRSSVEELPPRLREPFVMRVVQEQPYEEIATSLRLTHCNARKRVQLASRMLRGPLAEVMHPRTLRASSATRHARHA